MGPRARMRVQRASAYPPPPPRRGWVPLITTGLCLGTPRCRVFVVAFDALQQLARGLGARGPGSCCAARIGLLRLFLLHQVPIRVVGRGCRRLPPRQHTQLGTHGPSSAHSQSRQEGRTAPAHMRVCVCLSVCVRISMCVSGGSGGKRAHLEVGAGLGAIVCVAEDLHVQVARVWLVGRRQWEQNVRLERRPALRLPGAPQVSVATKGTTRKRAMRASIGAQSETEFARNEHLLSQPAQRIGPRNRIRPFTHHLSLSLARGLGRATVAHTHTWPRTGTVPSISTRESG
jgi:hypothetical protein